MSDLQVSVSYSATLNSTEVRAEAQEGAESVQASGEYEQFGELTAKLLRVPKSELDEKLRES